MSKVLRVGTNGQVDFVGLWQAVRWRRIWARRWR
jgi:hypothetical protein